MANDNKARSSRSKTEEPANQQVATDANWAYAPAEDPALHNHPPASSPLQPVSWTASEYVARDKNLGWFLVAGLAVFVLTVFIYIATQDVVSSVATAVVGLAFASFAGRPPRTVQYSIDNTGTYVGQKQYPYEQFGSFSVMQEGAVRSIMLMPSKRFGLPLVLHYDPNDEQKIVNILGAHLPSEEREVPAVDRLMTKIHF